MAEVLVVAKEAADAAEIKDVLVEEEDVAVEPHPVLTDLRLLSAATSCAGPA